MLIYYINTSNMGHAGCSEPEKWSGKEANILRMKKFLSINLHQGIKILALSILPFPLTVKQIFIKTG